MQPRLLVACAVPVLVLGTGCLHAGGASPTGASATAGRAPVAGAAAAPRAQPVNGLACNWSGPNGLAANGLGCNWSGPNGVHPGALPAGGFDGTGTIASQEFARWFAEDPGERSKSMVYFVRCAYAADTVIRYTDASGKAWSWPGQLGLAQQTFRADQRMTTDEGRWVSACLLAHVNMKGTHQYISIRGNPPAAATDARAALAPTAAERWTMSYPEGVFSGDAFAKTGAGGYTFGLDLPAAYDSASAVWQPPSLVLGRALDFDGWAPEPPAGANVPYMKIVGPYDQSRPRFSLSAGTPATDPEYRYDTVCTGAQGGAGCAPTFRPLFVLEPRLANLESPSPAASATMMQVLDTGATHLDLASQVRPCAANACIGERPGSGGSPGAGAKLVNLRAGQALEGVLRLTEPLQQSGLEVPPPDQAYTAIVRYASATAARARVRVSARDGSLRDLGVVPWTTTGGPDAYEWLQVYPVYASLSGTGRPVPTLRIEISGAPADAGGAAPPAPELDAVGFVPGWPWCSGKDVPFAQNCPR